MNFHDFFVFLRRMMILFMSCLYQTNDQKRYNRNEKLCSVQDIRYKCNTLGSQMFFNLQSMARVAHDLASADIFQKDMLASLKGLQFFDGCDKSKDRAAATKNDLAQWIDNGQHSEYQDFLVMLTKSCTCSGNAYCFVKQISFGECKDFKMAKSKACDGLADQETISVDNIKDFEVEIKTPFVLVQIITEILDELRQTYQVKF
ncbi:hypothetical protein KP509_1Z222900 [Ceratopteris richardii]|nr:hypothetical protein KP509_1Z222900 [Ceratopteris richardii]